MGLNASMNPINIACFVAGQQRGCEPGLVVTNPANFEEIVAVGIAANEAIVDEAVSAAVSALPKCELFPVQGRSDALEKVASELFARREELGLLLAKEEGKTLPEAIGEVGRAAQIFRFFAGEAIRLSGEIGDSTRPGITVEVRREPVGVIGMITPWNFPIAIPAWKIAPALAFGNSVVLKPAELAPASAYMLAEIISRSGFPEGALNLILGPGRTIGQRLVDHPSLDAMSFTGSQGVGAQIAEACSKRGVKYQLEMGGKNPLVVLDDADIDVAVNSAADGAYGSTGQKCTASSRLIVEAGIHDEFVEKLTNRLAQLVVGDPTAEGTSIGPVVDLVQLRKNLEYIDIAEKEGCKLVFGGEQILEGSNGFFQRPALFTEAKNSMRICQEEVFGPIAAVIRVADFDEAVACANDTEFGLSAGICTRSHKRVSEFKRRSKSGMVMVNLPTSGVDYHVPFGGVAGSSYGAREQGSFAKEFYTRVKTIYDCPV